MNKFISSLCFGLSHNSLTMSEEKRKMPRLMKKVYEEIMHHPKYKDFNESTHFAFYCGCVQGLSWSTKQNNAWCRQIWRIMYWDEEDTIGLY